MRIDTQKQTLTARDESIKKLLEMLQNKGEGKKKICSIDPICLKQKVQFPKLLNNVDGTSVNDCKARPRPAMAVV